MKKTTINPNDKKSNYFLFQKVEPFPHYHLRYMAMVLGISKHSFNYIQ